MPSERSGGGPAPSNDAPVPPLVVLDRIGHRFAEVEALRDLSFQVPAGQITVLLGPNGAGKTTAIRADHRRARRPCGARCATFGLDPDEDGHLVRPPLRCGVGQARALRPALGARQPGLRGRAVRAGRRRRHPRSRRRAARFGISDALQALVGGYSTGMKTRLALARSVLHDPELLLFDEPTSGLDPESSYAVLDLIREMTSHGHTVVMCTHLLAEAEGLADHVVVMEGGTDLVAGTPAELTQRFWPQPIVTFDAEDPRLLDRVASFPGVGGYRRDPSGVRIELDDLRRLPDMVGVAGGRRRAPDPCRTARADPRGPVLHDSTPGGRVGAVAGRRRRARRR